MDFFKKTWVKITGWVCVILGAVVLILGGTAVADVSKGITLVAGIIDAIGLLVVFITGLISKKE